jgi:hypothetical protein
MIGRSHRHRAQLCALLMLLALAGCQSQDDVRWGSVADVDAELFRTQVYPVLLRDCAFNRFCHGDPGRFLHVLGPGRTRVDPSLKPDEPATAIELQISYERARAMVSLTDVLTSSPLLMKPLDPSAGGVGHKGVDAYGNNVYSTKDAENYAILVSWALSLRGATAAGSSALPRAQ